LTALLLAEGARLDRIYYCPHHPDIGEPPYRGACECRKPLPGLLHQAARDLNLELSQSAMIGDSLRDLEAGYAAGCGTLILLRTGHGLAEEVKTRAANLGQAVAVYDDLTAAVDHLLRQGMSSRRTPTSSQPANSTSRRA
jgi:D-glycero-D-manno-heptose 1,7-bisphosphate phosphatase